MQMSNINRKDFIEILDEHKVARIQYLPSKEQDQVDALIVAKTTSKNASAGRPDCTHHKCGDERRAKTTIQLPHSIVWTTM